MRRAFQSSKWATALAGGALFAVTLAAMANEPAMAEETPEARLQRLEEQAARPLRWIIENGKLPNRRPRAAPSPAPALTPAPAPAAAPAAATRAPAVAERPKAPPRNETAAPAPVSARAPLAAAPAAERTARSPADDSAAAPAVRKPASAAAAAPAAGSQPRATTVAAHSPKAVPPPVAPPVDLDELTPISQPPPDVWPGFCLDRCDRYYYRVNFKVLPSGRVDQVRIVESNYARLNGAVVKAVRQWQYRPIPEEREEEVTIRMAPR